MYRKMFLNSFIGMCVAVFLLHVVLVIKSMESGQLIMILENKLNWNEFDTYLYEFFASCWSGLIIPFAFTLLGNSKRHEAVSIAINFILLFTVYFLWASFIFGLSLSPLSIALLLVYFVILDYWIIYIVQYMLLKKQVNSLNTKLNQMNTDNSAFLRG